jgi:hypothetical protein
VLVGTDLLLLVAPALVGGVMEGPVLVEPLQRGCGRRRVGGRDRPYLENCTVDASIFVAKLVRAHGGCLGTRSR